MRYAEMKDSGISWFGDIPKHWKTSFVRHHYSIVLGKMLCSEPTSEEDSFAPYLCAANVHFDGISFDNIKQMWFSSTEKTRYLVSLGDLLVVEGGAGAGGCAIVKELPSDLYIQNSILRVRTRKTSSSIYLRYVIEMLVKNGYIDLVCNKATIPHFTKEKLSETPFPVPPLAEQEAIAAYLDEKCAAIDEIIQQAKATIEEYKAWKASVIFEAVTKGLDPNAEMKDSGVEWIGLIPKHWKKRKIKKVCKLKTGTTPDTKHLEWFDGDVKWYTPADFSELYYLAESKRSLSKQAIKDMVATVIPQDSILFVGIGATAGKVGYSSYECSINQQITALIPTENIYPKYLMFFLISISKTVRELANYTTLPIINNTTLGIFDALLPPHSEQAAIADYLDKQCATIDGIITEKQTLIDELETYKKSLIFETVTGKRRVC